MSRAAPESPSAPLYHERAEEPKEKEEEEGGEEMAESGGRRSSTAPPVRCGSFGGERDRMGVPGSRGGRGARGDGFALVWGGRLLVLDHGDELVGVGVGRRVLPAQCPHDHLLRRREGLRQGYLCRGRLGLDM